MKQLSLEELLEAGAHFGHQVSKWHPSMRPYIYTERNTVHIIDLQQTQRKLTEAQQFIADVIAKDGTVLFVGTKKQARKIVKKAAEQVNMPFAVERWLGGTFTNFESIKKQVAKLKDLETKRQSGELAKYTKKEQVTFDREIERLNRFFGGLRSLNRLPEAIVVFDVIADHNAVREAQRKKVKIVALCDTNADVEQINYPIPVNDDAVKVIELMAAALVGAVEEGQKAKQHKKDALAKGQDAVQK
jgi:small subunit ribosomal protein S2